MIVTLVAYTSISEPALLEAGWIPSPEQNAWNVWEADLLAEFAGRLCYQSWSRPNEKTRANVDYLANILDSQHYSVLEHASASFYVARVSRSLLAELTRHRHLSFSVLSQRFVDESEGREVYPPALPPSQNTGDASLLLTEVAHQARVAYVQLAAALVARGLTRKQAREAARSVLPNATETKFIVTGNMRAWRDVISKRISPHADAEIRELATEFLRRLRMFAPNTFQDMKIP